ncbi:hypothetical protein TGVEG_288870 [Toxoplasma gondii VEG]|uniref:Uncharacterized protein n=2 Tax=Toxoplasma gondii TaxID=5811 RepID=B9QDV7_TOXGV|nr:hypothetical protein TGVEG_288870 [Toxoplasma gondii VEG]KFG28852.1 hypothetical protein TGP89_288870 [Toxoplasma gondii p89]CEL75888.1 TPA: hypothetical protein BN1205_082730 [Toxoplasma gondii VEG]
MRPPPSHLRFTQADVLFSPIPLPPSGFSEFSPLLFHFFCFFSSRSSHLVFLLPFLSSSPRTKRFCGVGKFPCSFLRGSCSALQRRRERTLGLCSFFPAFLASCTKFFSCAALPILPSFDSVLFSLCFSVCFPRSVNWGPCLRRPPSEAALLLAFLRKCRKRSSPPAYRRTEGEKERRKRREGASLLGAARFFSLQGNGAQTAPASLFSASLFRVSDREPKEETREAAEQLPETKLKQSQNTMHFS